MSALWEQTASVWCVYGEQGPSPITHSLGTRRLSGLGSCGTPDVLRCQVQGCPLLDSSPQVLRHPLFPPHGSHQQLPAPKEQ